MQKSYKNLAKYYDLFSQHKDYTKETNFILALTKKYKVKTDLILDVGCGTGTHLSLLQNDSKKLYGIDLNKEILDIAKRKVPEAIFKTGDMKDFCINKQFDLITCLYSVFNYNLDTKSALKTLKNFYKHLNDKGMVVISLYNERCTKSQMSLHVGEDSTTSVAKLNEFKYFPNERVVKSNYLVLIKSNNKLDFDVEREDILRIFDFNEINNLVKKSNFKHSYLYNGCTFEKANIRSKWPVLVLLK